MLILENSREHPYLLDYFMNFIFRFDLDGKATYGDYASTGIPPGNRHFIPRRAKLKAAGGV